MPSLNLPKASSRLNDLFLRTNTLLDHITGAIPTQQTISASNVQPLSLSRPNNLTSPRRKRNTICIACGTRFNSVSELDRHYNLKPEHSPYADERLYAASSASSDHSPHASRSARAVETEQTQAWPSDDKSGSADADGAEASGSTSSRRPRERSKSSSNLLTPTADSSSVAAAAPSSSPPPLRHVAASFSDTLQRPVQSGTSSSWLRGRASSAAAGDSSAEPKVPSSEARLAASGATGSWRLPGPSIIRGSKSSSSMLSSVALQSVTTVSNTQKDTSSSPSSFRTFAKSARAGRWESFQNEDEGVAPEAASESNPDAYASAGASSCRLHRALPSLPSPPSNPHPRRTASRPIDRGVNLLSGGAIGETGLSRRRSRSHHAGESDAPPPYTPAVTTLPRSQLHPAPSTAAMFTDFDIFVQTPIDPRPSITGALSRAGVSGHRWIEHRASSELADRDPFADDHAAVPDGLSLPSFHASSLSSPPAMPFSTLPRTRPPVQRPRPRAATNPFLTEGFGTSLSALRPAPPPRRAATSSNRFDSFVEDRQTQQGGDESYFHPFFGVEAEQADPSHEPPSRSSLSDDDEEIYADPLPDLVASGGQHVDDMDRQGTPTPQTPATPAGGTGGPLDFDKMPGAWQVDDPDNIMNGRMEGLGL